MGFELKINGETVHTIDIDPHLVKKLVVNQVEIPVQFGATELDFSVQYVSELDAEYQEALRHVAQLEIAEEVEKDIAKSQKKAPVKKKAAVKKAAPAKAASSKAK